MRPRDRAALILVAIAVAFAALAIGGAPRWAAATASLLAVASAVPYLTSRRTSSTWSPLWRPIIVALALTALQLVPLTEAIAEQLVPGKLSLARENAAAWGDAPPAWVAASYDPPATLVQLAKLCGYLALAYSCVRLASVRSARPWLATIVVGAAAAVVAVTLAHEAVGARAIYGVYEPAVAVRPSLLGPLINPNHLASLLAIAAPLALGLAVASAGGKRVGWFAVGLALIGTTLLTASRGGVLGLVAGLTVAVVILVVQHRAGTERSGRRIPTSVAVPAAITALCAVVLVAIFTAGDIAKELRATSLDDLDETPSKVQIWDDAGALVDENPWLGVGRGAFEHAFTAHAPTGRVMFSHVENSYLQAAIDWGLPGAAILAVALAIAARAGARRWRHGPLEAGAIGGLVALAIHDVADFSLELSSVAMVAIAAAAIVFPARLGTSRDASASHSIGPVAARAVALRASLVAAGAVVAVLALTPLAHTAREDAAEVVATAPADRLAEARAAMARHPSDFSLAGRAAEALFAARDPRAVRVVARALVMNPYHAGLHHLAARMLSASQNPEQATVEYAAALRWARDPAPIVEDVLRTFDDPAIAARALPSELALAPRIQLGLKAHPAVALAHAQAVAAASPREPRAQAILASAAIAEKRADLALPAAEAAWGGQRTARHAALLGRALALSGDRPAGIRLMQEAIPVVTTSRAVERFELALTLSDVQLGGGDVEGARETLRAAEPVVIGNRAHQALWHERLATLEEKLGNAAQAEYHRGRAASLR